MLKIVLTIFPFIEFTHIYDNGIIKTVNNSD